jgi:predicted ABC-type ATPase
MAPLLVVVAGPSGSGKSTFFPVNEFGIGFFNVDDRCAELNHGSYQAIPEPVRTQAQRECERFIAESIEQRRSLAVETTLRTLVAAAQAEQARDAGFHTRMVFIANDDVDNNIQRVARRSLDGGHGAPPERIREIYQASLANLPKVLPTFDEVFLYDNSGYASAPRLVRRYEAGQLIIDVSPTPRWLAALGP